MSDFKPVRIKKICDNCRYYSREFCHCNHPRGLSCPVLRNDNFCSLFDYREDDLHPTPKTHKVIPYRKNDEEHGVFFAEGDAVLYVGHMPEGWWYWCFHLLDNDAESVLQTIFDNTKYATEGFSSAYYSTEEELMSDLDTPTI